MALNPHLCSVVFFWEPFDQPWALSLIHSPCDTRQKEEFWDEVGSTGALFGGPWIILGDFNALSGPHEKWGGRSVGSSSSDGFFNL